MNKPLHAWKRWLARVRPRRLAPRLLVAIVLASTALALVSSGIQLYGDYRSDLDTIQDELAQIERTSLQALANSVWSYNETQIGLTLNGLLQVRDVQHVEVRSGVNEKFEAGRRIKGAASSGYTNFAIRLTSESFSARSLCRSASTASTAGSWAEGSSSWRRNRPRRFSWPCSSCTWSTAGSRGTSNTWPGMHAS